jgi:ElaA protein
MINWDIKVFDGLSLEEFHDLVALRIAIFVVEQNCPYLELDGKDSACYQLIGRVDDEIVAAARIVPAGVSYSEWSIGRVAIAPEQRGKYHGYMLMRQAMNFIHELEPGVPIRISAQSHLERFYTHLGFVFTGKTYDEDGIPHMEMLWGKELVV